MPEQQPVLRLGNYVLLLELAAGGMATVYIARQAGAAGFERLVIIKRVHRHLLKIREFHDMFFDEARVASLIRHPNVVSVDDVVESEDELFLVQPYVESVSLTALIDAANAKGERLAPSIVVRILSDTLAGLSAAHDAVDMRGNKLDVVHRDVSPHNILVGIDGRSRLIDFGIAKAARRITTTSGGIMKGKLAYMSPEQARQQPLDARADLFAAGAVLHETLTGERLFKGDDQADVLLNVLIGEIPAPSSIAADIPPQLDAVVRKALERESEDRYQAAADFLESLEKALPPAQPRDVAQVVERLCGHEIAARRLAVRDMLDEPRQSIPRLSATPPRGSSTGSDSASRRASKSDVTMAAATPPGPRLPEGPQSSTPSRRRMHFVAGAIASASLIGVLALLLGRGSSDLAPPPATSAPAATGSVAITLRADTPIETVSAEGLRSFSVDGNVATILVAPWSGALTVTAVLKGGASTTAVLDAAGPREVRLVTPAPKPVEPVEVAAAPVAEPTAAPDTPPPSASVSASATASATAPRTPAAPVTASKPKSTGTSQVRQPPTKSSPSGLKPNPFL